MDILKIYLAGPFFTPEQTQVQARLEAICLELDIPAFSPRLDCFCPPDATARQRSHTFHLNTHSIKFAEFVFARIDDFDAGTMWELGYAYANKIPCFAYTTHLDRGLNLMLAESGMLLVRGWTAIEQFLKGDVSVARKWEGDII